MKDEQAYLLHIRDAIDRILAYTEEGQDAFLGDSMIQDAVLRNMERGRLGNNRRRPITLKNLAPPADF